MLILEGSLTEQDFFRTLAGRVHAMHHLIDTKGLYHHFCEEKQSSTDISSGIAVCHALVEGQDEIECIMVFVPQGIEFCGFQASRVRVVVLLLSPPEKERVHVRLLARLLRLVSVEGFAPKVNEIGTAGELYSLFVQEDASHV